MNSMAGFPKAGTTVEIGHEPESLPVPFSLSLNVLQQQGPGPPQTERLHYSVSAARETELLRAFYNSAFQRNL
jgi:hypothetical protein